MVKKGHPHICSSASQTKSRRSTAFSLIALVLVLNINRVSNKTKLLAARLNFSSRQRKPTLLRPGGGHLRSLPLVQLQVSVSCSLLRRPPLLGPHDESRLPLSPPPPPPTTIKPALGTNTSGSRYEVAASGTDRTLLSEA